MIKALRYADAVGMPGRFFVWRRLRLMADHPGGIAALQKQRLIHLPGGAAGRKGLKMR